MVTSAGFNALLKIVEEPPEHIKFIFATTEPDKVIGTIRSRTHHYPFRLVPPDDPAYTLRRIWLTETEEQRYYQGFSNEGLWPLSHVAHIRPVFRTEDWDAYREVNRRFAEAAATWSSNASGWPAALASPPTRTWAGCSAARLRPKASARWRSAPGGKVPPRLRNAVERSRSCELGIDCLAGWGGRMSGV